MDWTRSMSLSFDYYLVEPSTWRDSRKLDTVTVCHITRDIDMATLGQSNFTIADIDDGERWIRCYMVAAQDGTQERICLGTFLVQTPRKTSDGMAAFVECTAYTPLHVLAEASPNTGYALAAGSNCVEAATAICTEHGVAPVVATTSDHVLDDHYVAPSDASWLDVAKTLLASAGMKIEVDPYGRIVFAPDVPMYMLSPSWTFRDDETSIILPEVSEEMDWYALPNVCVVSTPSGITGRAENADPESRLSTTYRGREVTLKVHDPDELRAGCTQAAADAYALRRLRDESCMEHVVNVAHGYCPVTIGDVVSVQAPSLGIYADAIVAKQDMELETALKVNATLKCKEVLW